MIHSTDLSPHQVPFRVIYQLGRFRVIGIDIDPRETAANILVQERVSETDGYEVVDGVRGWIDRGRYNSMSDDFAVTNARDHVARLAAQDDIRKAAEIRRS